jgi:antitoxin component YwqK of YwqJK toxin-antitoxin module
MTLAGRRWLLAVLVMAAGTAGWLLYLQRHPSSPRIREIGRHSVIRQNGVLRVPGEKSPFTGRLTETYPSGAKKVSIEVLQGRLHGASLGWHENGVPEVEEHFHQDFSDGPRTRWHPNGARRSYAMIRQGFIEGTYTEWHDNGRQAVVMEMRRGQPEGVVEAWHPSGALKSRSRMSGGKVLEREFFADSLATAGKAP